MAENTGLVFKMYTDLTNFDKGVKKAGSQLNGMQNQFSKVGGMIAGAFSTAAIIGFAQQVITVTAEFQKYNAVLTNTLGSSALAGKYLQQITEFASETPFAVNELTGAFVKLANQGFVPTMSELTKLGDIAASTGKTFDQLAEGIIDAQTGQFERLKEFGIKAAKSGDQVIFTFKGMTTEVANTSDSIQEYILGLGDAVGVTGSMAAISETLGGKISNLGDAWDQFMLSVGNSEGPLQGIIETLSEKLSDLTTVINAESIPAWKQWLAGFNIGPYRKEIIYTAKAAKNLIIEMQGVSLRENVTDPKARIARLNIVKDEIEETKLLINNLRSSNAEKLKEIENNKKLSPSERNKALKEEANRLKDIRDAYKDINDSLLDMNKLLQDGKFTQYNQPKKPFRQVVGGGGAIKPELIPTERNSAGNVIIEKQLTELDGYVNQASELLTSFQGDILATAAEGFGRLIAGDMGLAGFFNGILMLTADFAKQFGKLLITIGLAKISLEKLGISGIGAVIAGMALIGAASAIGALLSKGPEMPGLATGTNYVPQNGPYFLHQGEAVVPKKFNNGMGNASMPSTIRIVGDISGRNIRITQARESYYYNRTTGRS